MSPGLSIGPAAESIAQAKDTWQANASLPPLSA